MSNMTGNIIVMCRFRSRSRLWRLSQLSTTLFQLYHGRMYRFNVTRSVMSEPLCSKVETGLIMFPVIFDISILVHFNIVFLDFIFFCYGLI
jgi:hypothetical protein